MKNLIILEQKYLIFISLYEIRAPDCCLNVGEQFFIYDIVTLLLFKQINN